MVPPSNMPALDPDSRRKTRDILTHLRQRIVRGDFPPGDALAC